MLGFTSGTQQTIMSDSDKAFGWHMHKESADKFNSGNSQCFPFTGFTVVLHIVCDSVFIHADNTAITDSNSVYVLTKVINNRLYTVKGFLTVWNPVFFIADIYQLFEGIVISVFFTASVKIRSYLPVPGYNCSLYNSNHIQKDTKAGLEYPYNET